MATDNTVLNSGSGGDTIRDVAKTANSPAKTQVMILDVGGGLDSSPETAWTGSVGVNNQPVGSAALATAQATISTTAASIVAARTGASGTGRIAATLYNTGAVTVFVGNSGVTTGAGMPIPAGGAITLNTQAALYGITASSSVTVAVVETY
jgi:hypothetical protein